MDNQAALVEKLQSLPAEDQQKVLEFVESLAKQREKPAKIIDPLGMFAHLGVHISFEDIKEARREAWANFPRDFPTDAES